MQKAQHAIGSTQHIIFLPLKQVYTSTITQDIESGAILQGST